MAHPVEPRLIMGGALLRYLSCVYMRQVERQVRWAGCLLQVTCHV